MNGGRARTLARRWSGRRCRGRYTRPTPRPAGRNRAPTAPTSSRSSVPYRAPVTGRGARSTTHSQTDSRTARAATSPRTGSPVCNVRTTLTLPGGWARRTYNLHSLGADSGRLAARRRAHSRYDRGRPPERLRRRARRRRRNPHAGARARDLVPGLRGIAARDEWKYVRRLVRREFRAVVRDVRYLLLRARRQGLAVVHSRRGIRLCAAYIVADARAAKYGLSTTLSPIPGDLLCHDPRLATGQEPSTTSAFSRTATRESLDGDRGEYVDEQQLERRPSHATLETELRRRGRIRSGARNVSRGYADDGGLTPRMRDVLGAAARGKRIRATAAELHVSEQTVRSLRAAACARLGAPNITAAVVIALRRGELQ